MNIKEFYTFMLGFAIAGLIMTVAIAYDEAYAEVQIDITHQSSPGCGDDEQCYTPEAIRISHGESVTWTNTDTANHNVITGNPVDGLNGIFDSQLILPGNSFTFQFPSVDGDYEYFCLLHPWAQGIIVVGGMPEATEEPEPVIDFTPKIKVISDEVLNRLYPDAIIKTISNVGLDVNQNESFIVPYISDAEIITTSITQDVNTLSFSFKSSQVGGMFTMKLDPRLIEDVGSVWYTDTHNSGGMLEFTVTHDSGFDVIEFELPHVPVRGISMQGMNVVPEFGTIAMMILAVAVISVIAISAKSRLSIMPRY